MSRVPLITKPVARRSKNSFDLSYRQIMSAKAGQLLPFFVKDVIPGDKFKIDIAGLIRTMPLNSAAFLRCKAYYHFYFVPYSTLWHQFDSFISRQDNRTSMNAKGSGYLPCFRYGDMVQLLVDIVKTPNIEKDVNVGKQWRDLFGNLAVNDVRRLSMLLGYGDFESFGLSTTNMADAMPNLLRVLAYNKIYYDYYVNPYFETVKPELFNVDDLDCDTQSSANVLSSKNTLDFQKERLFQMFTVKYRQWKKDMFTSLLPSPQFGDVSVFYPDNFKLSLDSNFAKSYNGVRGHEVVVAPSTNLAGKLEPSKSVDLVFNGKSFNLSVLALRQAEALQRWKETTIRAGYKADAQQLAHYGVKPKNYYDDHAHYIGGFDSVVNIDEVIASTSAGDDQKLGDIAGKAVSAVDGRNINYDVSEFGVIMGILSFLPEAEYDGEMIERDVTRSQPFDFFTPEFENLGLQPLHAYELRGIYPGVDTHDNTTALDVLGYGPRYLEYKTSVDKVFNEFRTSRSLSAWCAPRFDLSIVDSLKLSPSLLHVNPRILDSIFGVKSDTSDKTDQFLCDLRVMCSALRPMSVVGLPQF